MPKPKQEEPTQEVAPVVSDEMITVKKSEWDDIVNTVAMLKESADVGRMARAESKRQGKVTPTGRVTVVGDRVVVAWRMKEDFVGKNPNGVWVERQIIGLTLDDGTKVDMPYTEFVKVRKANCTITNRTYDDIADILTLKVKLDDGRELEISSDPILIAFN